MATLPRPIVSGLTSQQRKEDAIERKRVMQEILADGPARLAAELERLRSLGVIDETGKRLSKETPTDMVPGAKRDFGG